MNKALTYIFLFSLIAFCAASQQTPQLIKINQLQNRIFNNSDTVYVVNFWATWCVPCVQELPELEAINKKYSNSTVKVLLVSLDFSEDLRSKLILFIEKKKLKSEVLLLDETDANYFIPKISEKWNGSIPFTILIHKKETLSFYERQIKADEIEKLLEQTEK